MTIHSFDDVLRQRKSLHSVQLTPGGETFALWRPVPWIAFGYFLIVAFVFFIASKLPVLGIVRDTFPGLSYFVVLPAIVVWGVFFAELDGIPPHRWATNYLRFLARPKRTLGAHVVAPDGRTVRYAGKVAIWWDLNCPRLHHGWVTGGKVATTVPVRFTHAIIHRRQVMASDDRRYVACGHEVDGKLQVRP